MQRYKKNHNSNTSRGSKTGRTILCLLLFSTSLLTLSAQQQNITLKDSKQTIGEVFKAIEQQTGFNIAYNRSKLNASKEVKLGKTSASLNDILLESLAGTNNTYKINGKHIVITPQSIVTQTLSGKVLDDETGKPLANADVTIAGKPNLKTKTDNKGRFSIKNIPLGSQTVAITTDGYKARERGIEITTGKPADMQIMLKAEKPAEAIVEPALVIEDVIVATISNDTQQVIPTDTIRKEMAITIPDATEPAQRKHPVFAQKTNLLYWATSTPNIGAEVYLGKKWTAEASIGYNPWQLSGRSSLRHWLVQPELRY